MPDYNENQNSKNNVGWQDVHALIVAAGKGSRFGLDIPKQYAKINGKTILEHTVNALAKSDAITHLFLVIASDDTLAPSLNLPLPTTLVQGGAERWQSVRAGVQAIIKSGADLQDLVVIHDAARPCVLPQHVDKVINAAATETYGAILGVPVVDTIKQVAKDKPVIKKTIDRSHLWKAQTPQVFRLGKLSEVLDKVATQNLMITDEASAFELCGYNISMVEGSPHNMKLTYAEDLILIDMILNNGS